MLINAVHETKGKAPSARIFTYEGTMQVVTTLTNAVLERLDEETMGMGTTDYNFDLVR